MPRTLPLAAALVFAAATAQAQSVEGASAGFGVSTFGLYGSAAYEVMPKLRLRGVLTGIPDFEFEGDKDDFGTDITADGSLGGIAALADYYPNGGGFRLSGGLFFSDSTLDGSGTGFEADDGMRYDDARIDASMRFEEDVAPMLAIGYVSGGARGWGFESEIGLIGIGGVNVTLDGTSGDSSVDAEFERDLQEMEDDANEMGEDLVVYPWLSLGVSYRF
ncbi:hypothetical protein [Limimaricola hongkongensis]|uniref:Outer membrane protein beta-barrel domain-containing protein n=1 Tax=Limimaricola hongkongensis DSM 17492 TaxID=1122180 RepID=A0A017HGP2_9RHOB|nr:hypothetical protein [Limimaricola hongkongensis]EYD72964.1 hypothetical protein Lokhon_00489 [Limimaricola hongkongensis DSM 17492]